MGEEVGAALRVGAAAVDVAASGATPASPPVPSPAITTSGRPAYGSRPLLVCWREPGSSASNSTSAASTDLADTGDSRSPLMHLS